MVDELNAILAVGLALVLLVGLFQTLVLVGLSVKLRDRLRTIERCIAEGVYWVYFDRALKPQVPLPKPEGWTVTTDFLVEVTRILHLTKPTLVVELGSGLSTIIVGLILKSLGTGKLVSIDHEEEYANKTKAAMTAYGLNDVVTVRHARLVQNTTGNGAKVWYDTKVLADLTDVNVLIVDGPPAAMHPEIREPAFYYFWERLLPGGVIVLDDANRPGEHAAVQRAQAAFAGIAIRYPKTVKGMAVLTKGVN